MGEVGGDIGLGSVMGLDVRVVGAEKLLGAVDSEFFGYVHVFAAAVIALAGIAFGVFICEDGAEGFEDGFGGVIFGGDELQVLLLAQDFALDGFVKLGVEFPYFVVHFVLLCPLLYSTSFSGFPALLLRLILSA